MLTLNDGRNELWQWDTSRKLTVDADCSQVHFSNKVFGRSIDMDVVDGVTTIPDILLQTDKELTAWAFVGTPENGYTKISKVFKVNKRNKPADYVFTPPEQTTLAGLVARLDKIEESQDPDVVKNAIENYLEQNPVEVPVQSVNGKTGEVNLTSEDVGAISQDDLQEATNQALEQAKASGEFDGAPGEQGPQGDPGEKGDPGVYILSEGETIEDAPADADVVIDPYDENAVEVITPPRTASVGQTIVVKAVDTNGKPTEWEAADFPEGGGASSWEDVGSTFEQGVVLAETSPVYSEDMGAFLLTDEVHVTVGNEYTVNWNGVEYICVCQEVVVDVVMSVLGNLGPLGGGDDTGEPFFIGFIPTDMVEEMGGITGQIMALDGSESVTLSITGVVETVTPIPEKYLDSIILYAGENNILYKTMDTSNPENALLTTGLRSILKSGKAVYVYYHNPDTGVENYVSVIQISFGVSGVGIGARVICVGVGDNVNNLVSYVFVTVNSLSDIP